MIGLSTNKRRLQHLIPLSVTTLKVIVIPDFATTGPAVGILSFKVRTSYKSTLLTIKFWQNLHLPFPLLVQDGDSWWFGNNSNRELLQVRLCWYMDGRSPWIPGCGQKWVREGNPGWCSQITPLMWATLPHTALEAGQLSSPASHRLLELPPSPLLSYGSRGSWPQHCYVWSESFIANDLFFCSLGRWTA